MGDGDDRKNCETYNDDERRPLLLNNGNLPNTTNTSREPRSIPNQRETDSSLYYNSVPPPISPTLPTAAGRYESIMRLGGAERHHLALNSSEGPPLIVMSNLFGGPAPDVESPMAAANGEAAAYGQNQSDESQALMSHCHGVTDRDDGENRKARRTLVLASILCLTVMIAEIIGGYIADSLAIMTDAAHLLTDFASFLISLFSLYVASRPATRRMSFGWHRAEVLGAFMSVLLIWIITGVLVYMAIERIANKSYDIKAVPMLITAAVGVAVNIIMAILLQAGGHHGHSHGGNGSGNGKRQRQPRRTSTDSLIDNSVTVENGDADDEIVVRQQNKRNINIRAAFIHVLGDFFQSVGVLIAAFVIFYHPEWKIVDPVCTFVFSILVLITTLAIMRDALNVLMEGSPRGVDFLEVADSLAGLKGVVRVHNLRIWSLTMDKVALSVHLAIGDNYDSQDILKTATSLLRNQFGVFECTIQIEHYSNDMEECAKCEHPKN